MSAPIAAPGPINHTKMVVKGVRIHREMLLTEDESTMQEVKELQEHNRNPDENDNLDRTHHERALRQAFEAAVNIKELRDRITLLEQSLAKVHGAGTSKPDDDKDDSSYDSKAKTANLIVCAKLRKVSSPPSKAF